MRFWWSSRQSTFAAFVCPQVGASAFALFAVRESARHDPNVVLVRLNPAVTASQCIWFMIACEQSSCRYAFDAIIWGSISSWLNI
ncbi:MAG: hypothetical protein CMM01_24300 [Rhodopirellula sp.]|nr:hypothetical protein [Rhodopirellula sp.]